MGNWLWTGFSTKNDTFLVALIYGSVFNAIVFYFNALYCFRFFSKSKWKYWLLGFVTILTATIIESYIDLQYATASGVGWTYFKSIGLDEKFDQYYNFLMYFDFFTASLGIHTIFWFASFAYLFPITLYRNIKLEKKRLEAELKYLKAQIEPHTLFNGINTVYHLIDEDVEQAKGFLLGFSNILRYQVYECKEEKITLGKEIKFLEDVFQLWQFRLGEDAQINWEFNDHFSDLPIAPLVFYPFVENAFKYLSSYNEADNNVLDATIKVQENTIQFTIKNTFERFNQTGHSGLGLENVKERLKLLYPSKHKLDIQEIDNTFEVNLTLELI